MKIFLIGFMGSGKSTIGQALATQLKYSFVDLDEYIEQNEKQTITEIFATKDEQVFRLLEQKYLQQLINQDHNLVIATGGGAPCYFNNMELMIESGQVVYLKISPEILASRLQLEKTKRPLIANLSNADLTTFISTKLEERSVFYEQANYIQVVGEQNVGELVSELKHLF